VADRIVRMPLPDGGARCDFSSVRIHTDSLAAESTRAVNARAYTVGDNIVFGAGQERACDGRRLLAHELTHVVQQRGAFGRTRLQRACGKDEVAKALPPDCPIVILASGGVPAGKRFKFDVNCDTFAPEEEAKLRAFLKAVPSTSELEVFGMASSDGDKGLNEMLGCVRANAAMNVIKDEHLEQSVKVWGSIGALAGTFGNPAFRAVVIREKKGGPPVPSSEPGLSNIFLVLGDKPNVVRNDPDDASLKGKAIQITLDKFQIALGSADIAGGGDCNKFRLGFFQICRPYDVQRAVYQAGSTALSDDRSDELRKQEPALDVFNVGDVWSYSSPANCANPGVLRNTEVLFQDRPRAGFALLRSPDRYLAGVAWHDFFFTAFSVQRPDGSLNHLKSFYWSVHYCESFAAPTGSDALGKGTVKKSEVKLGGVMDGAPSEPGLSLAGKPATTTCNEIVKATKSNIQVISSADISGSC
jgi:outer membrane protein OmpA-like peptidoglycan-associated protein